LSDAITSYASNNLFLGQNVGSSVTSGNNNTGIGTDTLTNLTTGGSNTTIGHFAGASISTGIRHTAIGSGALGQLGDGMDNTAIGNNAMFNHRGEGNTALGSGALARNGWVGTGDGSYNTAVGSYAMDSPDFTGSSNIALGYTAGSNITSGNDNIIIGNAVDAPSATGSNQLNIGNTIYGDMSDDRIGIGKVPDAGVELDVLGDIQYTGTLTDVSDRRLKTDIHPLRQRGNMLDKLGALETYSFRMIDDKEGTVEYGVMAQEIITQFPELVRVDRSTEEGYMSVNYIGLIAPLVEATKELKAENDSLRNQVTSMEDRLASLEGDLKGMKAHTGYGINRAGFDVWLLALLAGIIGAGSTVLVMSGFLRRRRQV
jgi:hypothetical protein